MSDIAVTGYAFPQPKPGIRVPRRLPALWRLYRLNRHSHLLLNLLGEADSHMLRDLGVNPSLRSRQDWITKLIGR